MKLKAWIERQTDWRGRPAIRLTFPVGARPYLNENVIRRNIGPRPWAEGFSVNSNGQAVRTYSR